MKNGARLKELIAKNNMSQKTFANKLNISPSTLNGYICSQREPDLNLLVNMASVLNVSLDFLLDFNSADGKFLILNSDESRLVKNYRELVNLDREKANEYMEFLLWRHGKR